MPSTNVLTFDQGITLLIEIGVFIILYLFYYLFFSDNMPFTNIIVTIFFCSLWLISLIVVTNVSSFLRT